MTPAPEGTRPSGIIFACAILFCLAIPWYPATAATLKVSTPADGDTRDNDLTLREALLLADGKLSRAISTAEKNRITGANWIESPPFSGLWTASFANPQIGTNYSDSIEFDSSVSGVSPTSALPNLGLNDNINGDRGSGTKVVLNGSSAGDAYGILVYDDNYQPSTNRVENLIVHHFQHGGIALGGPHGCVVQGIEAYSNGGDGISLFCYFNPLVNPRNNQIGGPGAARCYTYSNGRNGISIFSSNQDADTGNQNNLISNCFIGLKDSTGDSDQGNTEYGIYLSDSWGNTIDGNTISGNDIDGIKLESAFCRNNVIKNNRIGLSGNGSQAIGNSLSGIAIIGGSFNLIGGLGEGNEIGGNAYGIFISGNDNLVVNNAIGTNNNSAPGLGNSSYGIFVTGNHNDIGIDGYGNTICQNGSGVELRGNDNHVAGNFVGTNAAMVPGLGNTFVGISISNGSSGNIVGGVNNGRNFIAGNGVGVEIGDAGTNNNSVSFNAIGIDASGNALAPPNGVGIKIRDGAYGNIIGGASGRVNQIVGCTSHGIHIVGSLTFGNTVCNNFIGGVGGFGNAGHGILIENAAQNLIGLPGQPNVISGNAADGVQINGPAGQQNIVRANIIGLDVTQTVKRPNGFSGVVLVSGAHDNEIGGPGPSDSNIIAGNNGAGVFIANPQTQNNLIRSNYIGTSSISVPNLGNGGVGIALYDGTHANTIGGANLGNVISGNGGVGIDLANPNTSGNQIKGNRIGVTADGAGALANGGGGIRLFGGASNNTIGGNGATDRNQIGGNGGPGVGLYNPGTSGNQLQGNYIGTDAAGVALIPNHDFGVVVQESAGGNGISANLIGGHALAGIMIRHPGSNANTVSANIVGLDASGTAALPNGHGIAVEEGAQANHIGEAPGYNIIAGNTGDGIRLSGTGTSNNLVSLNVVGTNETGSTQIPNLGNGIALLNGASQNQIGGQIFFLPPNLIVMNGGWGVLIDGAQTANNVVIGNFIGLGFGAPAALGNLNGGVAITGGASGNAIGDAGLLGNAISGNHGPGVLIDGSMNNRLQGNVIGLDFPAATAVPNEGGGVVLQNGASLNLIGGANADHLNVIGGNLLRGIVCSGAATTSDTIQNNRIGVNGAGTVAIGNQSGGIYIEDGADHVLTLNVISGNGNDGVVLNQTRHVRVSANRIGLPANENSNLGNHGHGIRVYNGSAHIIGGAPGDGNTIAFNEGDGVCIAELPRRDAEAARTVLLPATGVSVRCNSIYDNTGLGINLGDEGVSPNDPNDPDMGPNEFQNFPIVLAFRGGAQPYVRGTFNSNPLAHYLLDFYADLQPDTSGNGEGKLWLGSMDVTTNASGNADFETTFNQSVDVQWHVSATATNDLGSTSEFSQDRKNAVRYWLEY